MSAAEKLIIRAYQPADQDNVINLWRECDLLVPWNNPVADIERKYTDSPELFFVAEINDEVVGSCMAGYDGHRGWIYFLAVRIQFQHQGIATRVVKHTESKLTGLGCPKLELMVRDSNEEVISFYKQNAYEIEPVVVLSKRLIEDEAHTYNV